MFYLLAALLFIILYYVFVKLLSSIVKGCLVAVLVLFLVLAGSVFIRSTKRPVYIFDWYKVDSFNIVKLR
jgi:ascorbate-specific PTS system EIIC-type component UlaA